MSCCIGDGPPPNPKPGPPRPGRVAGPPGPTPAGRVPGPPAATAGRVAGPPAVGRVVGPRGGPNPPPGPKPKLNMVITGTGPFASAGTVSDMRMSTLISGQAALSTCPTSCFVTVAWSPVFPSVVFSTVHVTLGTS